MSRPLDACAHSEVLPVNLATALQPREVSHMTHDKSSSGIVTVPLPDSGVLWLDLVFQMDKLNGAMIGLTRWPMEIQRRVSGKIHRSRAVERSDLR
jgi:hypothetical protein